MNKKDKTKKADPEKTVQKGKAPVKQVRTMDKKDNKSKKKP
jgi:hypothetical protein